MLIGSNEKPMSVGDFIYTRSSKAGEDREICQIVHLFEKRGEYFAHLRQYVRGCHTVLEETSDKREIFELKNW